jgi:hypothetical protein
MHKEECPVEPVSPLQCLKRLLSVQVPIGQEHVTHEASGKEFTVAWAQDESGGLQARPEHFSVRPVVATCSM